MSEHDAPVRYGAWSPDRRGRVAGLTLAAWTVILAAGLPMLLAVGADRYRLAAAWLPVWAVLVVLVAVPVRGRPAARWLIDSLWRAVGVVTGWSAWQSTAAAGLAADLHQPDLPGVLSGVRTFDGPPYGPAGVRPVLVCDNRERTWAAVARISHAGIGLADPDTRARMGASLSRLLESAVTGGLVATLALQVRTTPDNGAQRAAWQARHLRPDAPAVALTVVDQLDRVLSAAAVRHEAFLTVVVPEARIARPAREAGGGVDGRGRVLHAVMAEVEAGLLGGVGATSVEWLDSPGLAEAIRTGYAPGDAALLATAAIHASERPAASNGLPLAAAGPTIAPTPAGRSYTHDAWQTVTATVLLPNKGAVMGALAPVLAPSTPGERRCLTVFFEPIDGRRADRMVGGDQLSSELTTELRARAGFRIRATQRRDAERISTQDARLAEGNALIRVAAVAAITVDADTSISDAGRRLESAITAAGFTPLRLDLAQDSGFVAACIPLGIGLPRRRGTHR